MAEGEDNRKAPYLFRYGDDYPVLHVPIITITTEDSDTMVVGETENEAVEQGETEMEAKQEEVQEIEEPTIPMDTSSTNTESVVTIQNESDPDLDMLFTSFSCPNFQSISSYGSDAVISKMETDPSQEGAVGPDPDLESTAEAADDESESQEEWEGEGPSKRRVRKYSKKEYLTRRRTKQVVHSPYPSPTHLAFDNDDEEEDEEDENKKKEGKKDEDAGSKEEQ